MLTGGQGMAEGRGKKLEDSEYERDQLQKECELVKRSLKREFGLRQILGKSEAVKKLHRKIDQISSCDVNVLIYGESGSGKELTARAIHYLSDRAGKPFITANCGAIPENIFENELFGHVKGAFTDAGLDQIGLVREAEGGTLFLDEIGATNPYIQVKFLRMLQDKEYKTLGDPKTHKANIRIIAATNKNLQNLVNVGYFREDLFYRLNVANINIPPLRDRKDDIPILAGHFLTRYSLEYKRPHRSLSEDIMKVFISYSWPGNIRELENKIQQLVVTSTSPVINDRETCFNKSESITTETELEYFKWAKQKAINTFEKTYLSELLTKHKGDVVSAARCAGKSRTALWNLLKKHDISPKQFRY